MELLLHAKRPAANPTAREATLTRRAAFLICLVVSGCTGIGAAPTPSPGTGESRRADERQGAYTLGFELPKTTWRSGEAIGGTATLHLASANSADVSGSGSGLIGFDFAELGGSRHVVPAQTSDCRPYRLDPDRPMESAIVKSGGFYPEQRDFEFYRSFLSDPLVRLPAGEWTIAAVASFTEGRGCTGKGRTLRAAVKVRITP